MTNRYEQPLELGVESGDATCRNNLHRKLCFARGIPCREVKKEDCVDYILAKQKLDASRNEKSSISQSLVSHETSGNASYQERGGI